MPAATLKTETPSIGARVRFAFVFRSLEGRIVEDRGFIGRGGRHLWTIEFLVTEGDELSYITLGEDEFTVLPAIGTAEMADAIIAAL